MATAPLTITTPVDPLPASDEPRPSGSITADIAIIGAGMGGAAIAWGLRNSGADILVIDRGDFLPSEWENWPPHAVFEEGRYKNAEAWFDADREPFHPGNYYYIGGNTKLYGAMLPRFREQDFGVIDHRDGISPARPVTRTRKWSPTTPRLRRPPPTGRRRTGLTVQPSTPGGRRPGTEGERTPRQVRIAG